MAKKNKTKQKILSWLNTGTRLEASFEVNFHLVVNDAQVNKQILSETNAE